MRVIFALLLLYSTSLHAGDTEAPDLLGAEKITQPNIWTEVRDVRDMMVELSVNMDMLMKENARLDERLKNSEAKLEELKKENTENPKVAFSADLGHRGHLGPYNTDITQMFKNVFTNIATTQQQVSSQHQLKEFTSSDSQCVVLRTRNLWVDSCIEIARRLCQ